MLTPVELLGELFVKWSGAKARTILPLPQSGSSREYYRLSSDSVTAVGVHHTDLKENAAFVYFSRHFREAGLPVPEVYMEDLSNGIYLQQDLGDTMLFDLTERVGDEAKSLMLKSLDQVVYWLPKLQVIGHKGLDYSKATPRESFDKQSMMWDLNYFKYHFLKLSGVGFDEQKLEDDFVTLSGFLSSASRDFFMFRDFQSRNIMVQDDKVWFIDYQGGRRGYPAYDLASLLFDAKAGFSPELRSELHEKFIKHFVSISNIDTKEFESFYPGFVLIRKMQAMGAFGFRGIIEGKAHFLQSIPPAIQNLDWLMRNVKFDINIPELLRVLKELPQAKFIERINNQHG
jgi:aminoglycoside/choline kinase family phosphotransferase